MFSLVKLFSTLFLELFRMCQGQYPVGFTCIMSPYLHNTYEVDVSTHTLQMRKLSSREVKQFEKLTQLVSGGAGN